MRARPNLHELLDFRCTRCSDRDARLGYFLLHINSANTICLAITPSMKAKGARNRCRMRDIPAGMEYITAVPRMRRYMKVSVEIYREYLRYMCAEDT